MEAIFKILLIVHVISGFLALVAGVVPMIAKKGGKLHNNFGMVYFWAMFLVFASGQPMAIIRENVFFFTIGVFSFYLVFTGYRFAKRKGYHLLTMLDKRVMQFTLITSLIMIGYAIYWFFTGTNSGWKVLIVFGLLCFKFSIEDLLRFGKELKNKHWMIEHLNRMAGGYIATFTAFTVNNVRFLPPLVGWLLPSLIGGVLIWISVRKYKKKLGIGKNK